MALMFTSPIFAQSLTTKLKAQFLAPHVYKSRIETPKGIMAGKTRIQALNWVKAKGYPNLPTAQAELYKSSTADFYINTVNDFIEEIIDENSKCVNKKTWNSLYFNKEKLFFTTRLLDEEMVYSEGRMISVQLVLENNGVKTYGLKQQWEAGADINTTREWLNDSFENLLDKYMNSF
jgi:hypothetical protein